MSVPERVLVTCRVRPPLDFELESINEEDANVLTVDENRGSIIVNRTDYSGFSQKEYKFDTVLGPTAHHDDVYRNVAEDIVLDVLNGYNGTIMAYGQTGTGKTYTLTNMETNNLGIVPRAVHEVFNAIENDVEHEYGVSMSYVQIYKETIQDLLRPESTNMQIREDPESGVFISGVSSCRISCLEDCMDFYKLGEQNRIFANTKLNAHSSRSHAIIMLTVEKRHEYELEGSDDESHRLFRRVLIGNLFLVDLAGSERIKKSGSEGIRAEEARAINMSLSCLGNCIHALTDPRTKHIPFRDSKLTRLLQESLGGNARTHMVLNVGPLADHLSETISTLKFGQRAMKVKISAKVNEDLDYKTLSKKLQESLMDKDGQLSEIQLILQVKDGEIKKLKDTLGQAMQRKQELERIKTMEEEQKKIITESVEFEYNTKLADVEEEWQMKMHDVGSEWNEKLRKCESEWREKLAAVLRQHEEDLRAKEKEMEEREVRHSDSIKRAEVSLELEKAAHAETRDALFDMESLVKGLEEKYKKKLASLAEQNSALQNQLESKQSEQQVFETKQSTLQAEVSQLTTKLQEMTRTNKKLSNELKQVTTAAGRFESRAKELQVEAVMENMLYEVEIKSLKETVRSMRKKSDSSGNLVCALSRGVARLKNQAQSSLDKLNNPSEASVARERDAFLRCVDDIARPIRPRLSSPVPSPDPISRFGDKAKNQYKLANLPNWLPSVKDRIYVGDDTGPSIFSPKSQAVESDLASPSTARRKKLADVFLMEEAGPKDFNAENSEIVKQIDSVLTLTFQKGVDNEDRVVDLASLFELFQDYDHVLHVETESQREQLLHSFLSSRSDGKGNTIIPLSGTLNEVDGVSSELSLEEEVHQVWQHIQELSKQLQERDATIKKYQSGLVGGQLLVFTLTEMVEESLRDGHHSEYLASKRLDLLCAMTELLVDRHGRLADFEGSLDELKLKFRAYHQQVKSDQKTKEEQNAAARHIQKAYRKWLVQRHAREGLKELVDIRNQVVHQKDVTEGQLAKYESETGKLLLVQSFGHLDGLFRTLQSFFIAKNSHIWSEFVESSKKTKGRERGYSGSLPRYAARPTPHLNSVLDAIDSEPDSPLTRRSRTVSQATPSTYGDDDTSSQDVSPLALDSPDSSGRRKSF